MNIKIELNNINLATNIYNSEFLKEDLYALYHLN